MAKVVDFEAQKDPAYVAFVGRRMIAHGELVPVVVAVKDTIDAGEPSPVVVLDAVTSLPVDIDFRGTRGEVANRAWVEQTERASAARGPAGVGDDSQRGPGRPRLGVTAREVTLLPRHWDWLSQQPGGVSAALRRLVDEARRRGGRADRLRAAQESANRFMTALAGDEPGYEEASRALFGGDPARFAAHTAAWPADIRAHARRLADRVFAETERQPPTPGEDSLQ